MAQLPYTVVVNRTNEVASFVDLQEAKNYARQIAYGPVAVVEVRGHAAPIDTLYEVSRHDNYPEPFGARD